MVSAAHTKTFYFMASDRKGVRDAFPSISAYGQANGVKVGTDGLEAFWDYINSDVGIDSDAALQLFGSMLNQENREVDYQRSLENRQHAEQYNDPSQQLARLMGAGMSRQAAMALLQGGATTDALSQPSGIQFATQQEANKINKMNAVTGAISTGIQSLTSLVQAGTSLAQFPISYETQQAQLGMLQNSQSMSDLQLAAFERVGNVGQMLYNYQASHPDFVKPHSTAELGKYFRGLPDDEDDETGMLLKDYFNNQYRKDVRNPYFWSLGQDYFLRDNSTRAYQEREAEAEARREILYAQKELQGVTLQEHQTNLSTIKNQLSDYELVRDKVNERTLAQLDYDLKMLDSYNNPKYWQAKRQEILANANYQAYYAAIQRTLLDNEVKMSGYSVQMAARDASMADAELQAWSDPKYQSLLQTAIRMERYGFTGVFSDIVKVGVFGEDVGNTLYDQLDKYIGQREQLPDPSNNPDKYKGHPLDAMRDSWNKNRPFYAPKIPTGK